MDDRTIRTRLQKYFAHTRYPVQFAYLLGSHARGQALPYSDIDVGVYVDEPNEDKRHRMWLQMLNGIMDALHTENVDVVFLPSAKEA